MDDKRKNPRKDVQIKLEVHTEEGMTFSSTGDLSKTGLFITTPEPLKEGEQLQLNLHLPNEELTINGNVRWNREETEDNRAGMGVEFVNVSTDDIEKINKHLD